MRHKNLVTAVLWSLVMLPACLATSDDQLASFLNNLPITTTESSDYDLNLDPDLSDMIVDSTSESAQPSVKDSTSESAPPSVKDGPVKCKSDDVEDGVCVSYYICERDTKSLLEDGYSIVDIRDSGPCPHFLEVCCKLGNVNADKKQKHDLRNIAAVLKATIPQNTHAVTEPLAGRESASNSSCGFTNRGVNDLRTSVASQVADFGEFPWMVALLKRKNHDVWKKKYYLGGGTLIHASVVMTAAHKVLGLKAQKIKIRAGEWDTNSMDEEYVHQDRDVSKIIRHPNFNRPADNNVALLILKTPVQLDNAPHITLACLGRQMPPPRTECFSMGWGKENFSNKSVFAAILKKVKLPLVSSTECTKMLQATKLGLGYRLHESLTCAGGQANVDTCKGDGGSSLVCPFYDRQIGDTMRYAVYGMVAYGINCGLENVPGVYVNVPHVYDWIVQQFAKEGLDHSSFVI